MQTFQIKLDHFVEQDCFEQICFGTCSCILKPGIRVELVGGDISVTLVGSVPYVDSVLSIFAFEKTEVVCVRG